MIRLTSQIAVAAIRASGTPAMTPDASALPEGRLVPPDQLMHGLSIAGRKPSAGEPAIALGSRRPIAGGIHDGIRLGGATVGEVNAELAKDWEHPEDRCRADRVETIVWRIWRSISRILNSQPCANHL